MIVDGVYRWFMALDLYMKFAVGFFAFSVWLGFWVYGFFEKPKIEKGMTMKSQIMFYLKQRGNYMDRSIMEHLERIVEKDLKNEGLISNYFVASIMYDDPKTVGKDKCRMVAGLCFPPSKLTPKMEQKLKKHGFGRIELPDCTVDMGHTFTFNNLSLSLARRRMLQLRQKMLFEEKIEDAGVYPLMEIYFPDKTAFAFPTAVKGDDNAKSLGATTIFRHPDDAKKTN